MSINSDSSGVVYQRDFPEVASSITYIDPLNPPSNKYLFSRGLLESSWSLLFSIILVPVLCATNSVLEIASLPHVPTVIAGFLGAMISYLVFLPLFLWSARGTKADFIALGGNPTGITLMMFCGMLPMGKSRWQSYKFMTPKERAKIKAKSVAKPVTGLLF